jgi:hypothetical protein
VGSGCWRYGGMSHRITNVRTPLSLPSKQVVRESAQTSLIHVKIPFYYLSDRRQGLTRPEATFVAFSTVTAPTAAETKFAPHTLGAIREGAPSPRWRAVHAYGFDRERTAHGSSIPNFNLFPAESQIPVPNLPIAGASSQSA